LADYLAERGKLANSEIKIVARKVISALAYCHGEGYLHRDIKLDNILLVHKEDLSSLVLADFGLSTKKHSECFSEGIGTALYMAPEIINTTYDEKSDIWAAGVLLYILATGRPPFMGNSVKDLYINILQSNSSIIQSSGLNDSKLKDLLSSMLEYDSKCRPGASELLEFDFIKFAYPQNSHPDLAELLQYLNDYGNQGNKFKMMCHWYSTQWNQSKSLPFIKSFQLMNSFSKTGVISRASFLLIFRGIAPEKTLEEIFDRIDYSREGELQYSHIQAIFCQETTLQLASGLQQLSSEGFSNSIQPNLNGYAVSFAELMQFIETAN